jgi:HK97 gp10 family phage protein
MSSLFKEYRREFDERIKLIEKFENAYVLVGFQEGQVTKSQVKNGRSKKAGQSMPQIAAQNEFGTDKIPARPFMRTSFDENRNKLNVAIQTEYGKIVDGQSTVKKSLNAIGLLGIDLIQTKIRSIHYPPNSPRTIARKKSSKPLIDFGQMVQAVTKKVVIP